jgi:phosphate starvation-inducible PhoH-like protein
LPAIDIEFDDNDLLPVLFGEHNANLNVLEKSLGISISGRGNHLVIEGGDEELRLANVVLSALWDKVKRDEEIGTAEVEAALRFAKQTEGPDVSGNGNGSKHPNDIHEFADAKSVIKTKKKTIAPRSPMQASYVKAITEKEMVFGLGPAGTGKTYLAVAMAVQAFVKGEVAKMIFCRPALEAGERIGFLPGDLKEKVDPYLRPVYDALHDMLPWDFVQKKMDNGEIEIVPLAFMRGRTLTNAFIVLDEAQNATPSQMKMFLTRMGERSKVVVTGDPSQSDLPDSYPAGLEEAIRILADVPDISFIHFTGKDVVRHALVQRIVEAYAAKTRST